MQTVRFSVLWILSLLMFIQGTPLKAQLGFTYTKLTYDPVAYVTFDDITNRNKIEFDTDPCFCSPNYIVKISSSKHDSVSGLMLGRNYQVRNIQIDNTGRNIGTHQAQGGYPVNGYALPELFNQSSSVVKFQKFSQYLFYYTGSETVMELYYDTVPGFNSPAFRDLSNKPGADPYFSQKIHGKKYYLKAKSTFRNQVLPEKVIEVTNDFSPMVSVNINSCITSPPRINLNVQSKVYGTTFYRGKFYYRVNNVWDSLNQSPNLTTRILNLTDTGSIFYKWYEHYSFGGDTVFFRDSARVANPVYSAWPIFSPGNYADHNVFNVTNLGCAATIEVEAWTDSTMSALMLKRSKLIGSNKTDSLRLKFNMYDNNFIRYRYQRNGLWSVWYTFSRMNYRIQDLVQSASLGDTIYEYLIADVFNNYKGKQLIAELDQSPLFNTTEKLTFTLRDTIRILIPLRYRKLQYIRYRQTDGKWYSPWSAVHIKKYTDRFISPKPGCNCNYPFLAFAPAGMVIRSMFDLEVGPSPTELNWKYRDTYTVVDRAPLVIQQPVYARIRYRTKLDTAYWSEVTSCTYKPGNFNFCATPFVHYIGQLKGADTIHIRYTDKDPSGTRKVVLLIGNAKKEIVGFKVLAKGSSLEVLSAQYIPRDAYVALVPECAAPSSIYTGSWQWYPVSGKALSGNPVSLKPNWFFDQSSLKLMLPDEPSTVTVYTSSGQLLRTFENVKQEVDLSGVAHGVYIIRVSNNYFTSSVKVIIP